MAADAFEMVIYGAALQYGLIILTLCLINFLEKKANDLLIN
jgi:hypothetical protein